MRMLLCLVFASLPAWAEPLSPQERDLLNKEKRNYYEGGQVTDDPRSGSVKQWDGNAQRQLFETAAPAYNKGLEEKCESGNRNAAGNCRDVTGAYARDNSEKCWVSDKNTGALSEQPCNRNPATTDPRLKNQKVGIDENGSGR